MFLYRRKSYQPQSYKYESGQIIEQGEDLSFGLQADTTQSTKTLLYKTLLNSNGATLNLFLFC